jgi:hypothetical protein
MKDESQIDPNDPDYDDPILAEIREIRNEFSDRFNGDMAAMSRYIRQRELLHPERWSSRKPLNPMQPAAERARENS